MIHNLRRSEAAFFHNKYEEAKDVSFVKANKFMNLQYGGS